MPPTTVVAKAGKQLLPWTVGSLIFATKLGASFKLLLQMSEKHIRRESKILFERSCLNCCLDNKRCGSTLIVLCVQSNESYEVV
jgi:hypothetical protein